MEQQPVQVSCSSYHTACTRVVWPTPKTHGHASSHPFGEWPSIDHHHPHHHGNKRTNAPNGLWSHCMLYVCHRAVSPRGFWRRGSRVSRDTSTGSLQTPCPGPRRKWHEESNPKENSKKRKKKNKKKELKPPRLRWLEWASHQNENTMPPLRVAPSSNHHSHRW